MNYDGPPIACGDPISTSDVEEPAAVVSGCGQNTIGSIAYRPESEKKTYVQNVRRTRISLLYGRGFSRCTFSIYLSRRSLFYCGPETHRRTRPRYKRDGRDHRFVIFISLLSLSSDKRRVNPIRQPTRRRIQTTERRCTDERDDTKRTVAVR